jgi:iron complex outermembrane receptor protein
MKNIVFLHGQTTTAFLPIEQTTAVRVDLSFQQNDCFKLPLDVMLNTTINASLRY